MKDTSNVLSLISPHDENYVRIRQATKQGYILCPIQGGVCDLAFPNSKLRRGRVQGGGTICPTLMAGTPTIYVLEKEE